LQETSEEGMVSGLVMAAAMKEVHDKIDEEP
jgi:hypothetical protein